MAIKGILFDLDGTVINTNELIFQSFEYALENVLHTTLSRDVLRTTFGKPLAQIMEEMGGNQAQELRKAFVDYSIAHETDIYLFPHVEDALKELKARNIGTAVVTSRLYRSALRDLHQFELEKYFDVFITPEATEKHKPNPEPALKALELLGIKPQEAIMVGDSGLDLLCGKQAGCKTAAVRYSLFPEEELAQHQPDYMLDSLLDLLPLVNA
ncbi:MAG: HAD-IA family hydrolase [Peptococcaceae bacterium]|nr:HAD-IA family hydrolase [Peptococcaceae bacterium]